MNIEKFKYFTDDELYILHRMAVESSYEIMHNDLYNDYERKLHNRLLNEMVLELKHKKNKGG